MNKGSNSIQLLKDALYENECGNFVLSDDWLEQADQVIDMQERRIKDHTFNLYLLAYDERVLVWNWLVHWRTQNGNPKIESLFIDTKRKRLLWQVGKRRYSESLEKIFKVVLKH